ncbi:MAG: transporter substrate-binding domain-containing protein [Methyloprofundus sp.]|nr:transporter substrate-binding domain-containing protein [Methyloprofundus sp.]
MKLAIINLCQRLLFGIVYLSLCISHAQAELTEPLTKVSLQLMWKHQFEFAGFYAAIEQGYYQEVGLDVELREYQNDRNLVNEVISGRAHYGVSDSSLIIHRGHGDPVILLANIFQHSPMVLLSRDDAKILSPAQMAGKSIMLSTYEKDNASIIAMLNTESVKLNQLNVKQHSFNIDDFIDGKVDIISAYATNEPGILKERQFKFNIIDPINYGIDFYGNNIFTSEKHSQENPRQTADFIAASLKGWQYALANSDEIIELILTKYSTDKTRSALEYEAKALQRFILPEHITLGTIDSMRMERIVDAYKQLKMIPKGFTLEGFIYQQIGHLEPSLQLTEEEQHWIKQHPQVSIGVDPARAPFEYLDKQAQYSGMASDYLKLIAEKTGLEFVVQSNATWNDVMISARSGKLDLLPAVMASPQREEFLDFSRPYINYPMVIVTGKDSAFISQLEELHNKQVGVVGDYVIEDILRNNHPGIKLKTAKNLQQALKWVASGEVDAMIDNLASVTYAISQLGITNLRISGTTPYEFALAVAVPEQHAILLAIIQKALDSINKKQAQAIQRQWIAVTYEQRVDYKKYLYFSLAVLLFILIILLWNRRLSTEIKARKAAESALYESQRILEYKNNILELLSKGSNLKTTLETLIGYLESSRPEMIGSILLLDKQKKHLINGVAISLPENYMQAIDGVAIGPGMGSCGTAAFTGEKVIVEDIMNHPYWEGFQELAQAAGVAACWSQPIVSSSDEILGTFAIYYRQPTSPSQENLKLIHEFSVLTALAIESIQSNETLKKLSLAVTQSANIVIITNHKGIIEYVNPKFSEITGYSSEEVIGNTPGLLKSGLTDKSVYTDLWNALLAGEKWQGEFLNRKKNGELYWAWDSVAPIHDERGEITHFVAVETDYTERKQAEVALEKAKLDAEQANKVKSEFLATMTHELRTPMNGVLGMAQILEETELTPEQRESVSIILHSGNSLLEIINDVLDLSKLESEQVILEERYFNLGELIANTFSILRPISQEKSLQLSVVYPTDYPRYFVGDPTRLQQILLNLLSNALKFTTEGYVRLTVFCNIVSKEQAHIKLSVEDTGIGIADENIAHLFDPFVQADQTTTRKYGGSGLGLAVSKKLINLMQGHIGVNSVSGQGANFWVTLSLPLADMDIVKHDKNTKVLNHAVFNGKLLIVEDDIINQQIACNMLSKTGLIIDIAKNGQQAINLWQQNDYDLILMDCRMPVMDGYQATALIRAQELESHIPIIALTANSGAEDRRHCLDSGMNEVITKPFKKEFLIKSLSKWLSPVLADDENNVVAADYEMTEVLSLEKSVKDTSLDRVLLEKLKQEMAEDFAEIYTTITQAIEKIIQQLDNELAGMPNETIAQLAHSLKSPAASLGAIKLSKIAAELEIYADNDVLKDRDIKIQQLKREYRRVLIELEKVGL